MSAIDFVKFINAALIAPPIVNCSIPLQAPTPTTLITVPPCVINAGQADRFIRT
jgi:hypothetical protein